MMDDKEFKAFLDELERPDTLMASGLFEPSGPTADDYDELARFHLGED